MPYARVMIKPTPSDLTPNPLARGFFEKNFVDGALKEHIAGAFNEYGESLDPEDITVLSVEESERSPADIFIEIKAIRTDLREAAQEMILLELERMLAFYFLPAQVPSLEITLDLSLAAVSRREQQPSSPFAH